jgi:DNA-binding LacI/PurR family transcriptional regulator
MATLNDIAKHAGVSNRTVSAVLNNRQGTVRVSSATRERVLASAQELNYTPNVIAQGLRTGQSFLVGVIVAQITNSFIPEVLQGIENVLTANNYSMLLCTYHNEQELKAKLSILEQKKVDGLVVFSDARQPVNQVCDSIIKSRPTVFIGSDQEKYDSPCIYTNGVQIGFTATEYLLRLGHRRIAFLAGACPEREEGYKAALIQAGLTKDSCIVVENCIDCSCGKTAFNKLRTEGSMPTAVISYSDNVAAGFIAAAIDAGVKVPEEVSVVGIDNLPVAEMLAPALTTISQPKTEQGSTATDLLLKMINGEKLSRENSVVFEPSLVIRKSCKEL